MTALLPTPPSRRPGAFSRPKRGRYLRVSPAERTSVEGVVFDSKAELRRWEELCLLQRAGAICELRRQQKLPLAFEGRPVKIRSARYPNGRECSYTVDFVYFDNGSGRPVYEEYKAVWTTDARLRIAVVEAIYGIQIMVTGPAVMPGARRAP